MCTLSLHPLCTRSFPPLFKYGTLEGSSLTVGTLEQQKTKSVHAGRPGPTPGFLAEGTRGEGISSILPQGSTLMHSTAQHAGLVSRTSRSQELTGDAGNGTEPIPRFARDSAPLFWFFCILSQNDQHHAAVRI